MKYLLHLALLMVSCPVVYAQIPASGNVLWLKANTGVFKDNMHTPAAIGDLVQVWEDQSGAGNDFSQNTFGRRPQSVIHAGLLCSTPLMHFDISRMTYLASAMKLSGAKTIFIVFLSQAIVGNPQTLLSIKGNSNSYSEILCTDAPGYAPLSFISDVRGSVSGGSLTTACGNNATFSVNGNLFMLTYDGGPDSLSSCYTSRYDAAPAIVTASGLFGRLLNDTTTIGARAPQQNYCFFTGYIGEVIVYDRVLSNAEASQVETYLATKYGFFGSCSLLAIPALNFTARSNNNAIELTWEDTGMKEYIVEHSTDGNKWDSIGTGKLLPGNSYRLIHVAPGEGPNYYRLKWNGSDGRFSYSVVKKVTFSASSPFTVFPNPVKNTVSVQTVANEPLSIVTSNACGSLVRTSAFPGNAVIDLHDLPAGIYFMKISTRHNKAIQKIIKQ